MKYTLTTRLVGAALLFAIALIFLPGFFKDKQLAPVSTKTQIPPKPSITAEEFKSPQVPDSIEPAPAPETMFMPEDQAAEQTSSVQMSATQTSMVPASTAQTSEVSSLATQTASTKAQAIKSSASSKSSKVSSSMASQVPVAHLNEKGIPEAWMVQVGGFATKEAADKIRDQLQAQGLRAFDRSVTNIKGVAAKVFVGPVLDKSQAATIKVQVDKQLKVNSIIVKFQP